MENFGYVGTHVEVKIYRMYKFVNNLRRLLIFLRKSEEHFNEEVEDFIPIV